MKGNNFVRPGILSLFASFFIHYLLGKYVFYVPPVQVGNDWWNIGCRTTKHDRCSDWERN